MIIVENKKKISLKGIVLILRFVTNYLISVDYMVPFGAICSGFESHHSRLRGRDENADLGL